jgi:predicted DNA-binding protein
MSSGPTKSRKDREGKTIEVRLPDNERDALDAHCETTGETRTSVVRSALRKELGMPEPKEDV